MSTEKTLLENDSQPSCLVVVRQRISLLPNHKMSDKLFNKKADELASLMVNSMGCEVISTIKFFAPLRGEYWQFQYIA